MNAKMSDQEKITFANDLFWARKAKHVISNFLSYKESPKKPSLAIAQAGSLCSSSSTQQVCMCLAFLAIAIYHISVLQAV